MAKATCKEMTLFSKHRSYMSAIYERLVYIDEKRESLGIRGAYLDRESAALKYAHELILKEVLKDAHAVLNSSQDEREREICQKFLGKWR